jgi:signal transduction histidine kinase
MIGSLSLRLGGVISSGATLGVVRTWWLGDFSGALIVVPLALALWHPLNRSFSRRRGIEGLLALAAVIGSSELALRGNHPLSYLVFPALIWTALRLRQQGSTLAVAVAAGFAVWATTHSIGPFAAHSLTLGVLETQLFVVVASLSTLSLAAVVSERDRFAQDLWASRVRVLEAVDTERCRIKRDLHDGAQQELLAVRVTLDRVAEATTQDPPSAQRMIAALGRQLDHTLEAIRALAGGIYPALLDERGIAEALRSAARRAPPPVSIHASGIGRFSDDVEHAVYFCCLEALQNSVKHAGPGVEIAIRLWIKGHWLHFELSDTGPGFDQTEDRSGHGLTNMRDRVDSVGGALTMNSHNAHGTWVHGRVPID